jgi:predicted nucleic acid-binding protein
MIDAMLDTDVLVETLRGRTEAGDWLRSLGSQHIGISVLVRMEILQGAQDRREQTLLSREMSRYTLVHLEHIDSEIALGWFESFHLSHNVGMMDCLVAAAAVRLGVPLYSFNLKHYSTLPDLDVHSPY